MRAAVVSFKGKSHQARIRGVRTSQQRRSAGYLEGTEIEAAWGGGSIYWAGTIARARGDGTYDVEYHPVKVWDASTGRYRFETKEKEYRVATRSIRLSAAAGAADEHVWYDVTYESDGEEQDDVDAMHVSPDHGFTLTRSAKAHADGDSRTAAARSARRATQRCPRMAKLSST